MTWPTTPHRPRAVTIGEGLAVLVAQPGPLEESETFDRSAGGAEANVATVLTQLAVEAGWISRVGDDGFGRYLTGHLRARGVDVSAVVTDPTRPTAMYVKERGGGSGRATDLAARDSRMLYYRTGSAASALSTADLAAAAGLLDRCALVHCTGITTALSESATELTEALIALPRRGRLVSFDLNFRPALWAGRAEQAAEILARHVRGSDVVFLGADEAGTVFGTEDADELRALFPEPGQLVVKNNEHSVTGFSGPDRVEVPALSLDVTERIGAGDAFAGGYLAALLHGRPLEQRLRFGHLCAAAALTGTGDVAELPAPERLAALAACSGTDWTRLRYTDAVVTENVTL
ncbi:sugar kinase [Nocardia goodfellowii]|uniref:2-dehydro-3-deoxygluconokinase n=1 Tax=Nocardia goodfellowii TaxID=882446 RepID=A0ABS4QJB7_9NOCA|nr:sugar kinase [Nocardia goodfellowii]MBP2191804.1 2-dehydro-3-deoxygluconokinase [Nocardia goodfellowii]